MNTNCKQIKVSVGDFRVNRDERNAIYKVLESGRISEGEYARKFEEEWAKYIGTKYSVVLNSGTSALISGLTALKYRQKNSKVKNGTKVITTPITYIATSNAIVLSGLEPVYVDVDKDTFCITPENIRAHLEEVDAPEEYSLILPVHLMGYPCDMDKINKIAKKYGMLVFEDSAQAHGTLYKGKKVGSLSLLSDFSFYIAHNIQVGEMGTINTNDYEIIKLIKRIKANGRLCDCPTCTRKTTGCPKIKVTKQDIDPKFTHDIIGYNFKTTEFQPALGLAQLKKIDWIIERRRQNVKYLNEGLEKFSSALQLPKYNENVSYMAYPLIIKNPKRANRKKIRKKLEQMGIETRPLFGCIPTQQPAYNYLREKYRGRLPTAENVGLNGFYIGCHQYLTRKDLDYIIKTFGMVYHELLE
jgi:dTDP-4-amino-4,6-dideoxygalactose transaminase